MTLAMLLALQPTPQALPPPSTALPLIEFDLSKVPRADLCETGAVASDIVVCGRRPSVGYDYEKWARLFRVEPLVAEKFIGPGTTAGIYVDSVPMPGGQVSKRALVGVKLKF